MKRYKYETHLHKVFEGVEVSYEGTDFLVYGLDKNWYLAHPQIMEMTKRDELDIMMQSGALIIQAHPFREARYIDHIRLFPRNIHGVEIINANRLEAENQIAAYYAEHYGLLTFAGSDNHSGGLQQKLAGVSFDEPVTDELDFVSKVKAGAAEIFTLSN